jgi:hypothetical protein
MVPCPAAGGFERPASRDDGTGRHELVVDLTVRASQPPDGSLDVVADRTGEEPSVQPVRALVAVGDVAVQ